MLEPSSGYTAQHGSQHGMVHTGGGGGGGGNTNTDQSPVLLTDQGEGGVTRTRWCAVAPV